VSVLNRLSEPSSELLIVSGLLSAPRLWPDSRSKPNFVAITTSSRKGSSARLADELLVRERPVHLRGVEERHAALDRGARESDHLVPVGDRQVALAHAHAAEADRRHLEISESAYVHCCSFQRGTSRSVAARATGAAISSSSSPVHPAIRAPPSP
jgi:hypothetical protein